MRGVRISVFALVLLGAAQLGAPPTQAQTVGINGNFIIFDVGLPGATCLESFRICIRAVAIDPGGTVTGYYADAQQVFHGFLRTPDGKFASVEPLDAVCPARFFCSQATAINPAGAIIGRYRTSEGMLGFLRSPDGTYTRIAPPDALTVFPNGINPQGAVTGSYLGADFNTHGFVLSMDREYQSFDAPNGGNVTTVAGIDAEGDIAGNYIDESGTPHGFLRTRDGLLLDIDPTGSAATTVAGINTGGEVAGSYLDQNSMPHGFLRAKNGSFTTFTVSTASQILVETGAVNPAGAITGFYQPTVVPRFHGFLWTRNGGVISFDPSSLALFTEPFGINPGGAIAGSFIDTAFLEHGFIRLPSATETAALHAARRR